MSAPKDAILTEALLRMTEVALAAYISSPTKWDLKDMNVGEAAARAAFCAMKELHHLVGEEAQS